ncbi:MAG TPA: dihydroorotase [Acidimicrobiales bacterium]|nr:dihydroorotase [Acidimicrobiales bacterium]
MPERATEIYPLVIGGGEVVDANGRRRADLAIASDGTIAAVGDDLVGTRTLDASGCVVMPGLVDLHSHLREPGGEDAETILSGSRCAVRGGYTGIVAMPNTNPAVDSAAVVRQVLDAGRDAACEVVTSAAITVGRKGESLSPMGELADLGVRLFTDDGTGVQDGRLMRRALEYGRSLGVTLAQHCEDAELAAGGHLHEGEWSARLGIAGQPAEAEELMVQRDLALARLTGARMHFQHLSTARSVEMMRVAKAEGLDVTAEATPHHLVLTHASCAGFDPVFKVNPPLRTDDDVAAVRAGLVDGTIDVVATDHAPHPPQAKEQPFDLAPPGMLGLEVALAVVHTELGADLGLDGIVQTMSLRPARIAGMTNQGRPIDVGEVANLCVFDPTATWEVSAEDTMSRSRNNPWAGRTLTGRVRHTIVAGNPVVQDGSL